MGIWDWFSGLFSTSSDSSSTPVVSTDWESSSCRINPATGLPMVGGCGGVDVQGNPYGTDLHSDDDSSSSSIAIDTDSTGSAFDDYWNSTSAFDDSWGHSSSFDD